MSATVLEFKSATRPIAQFIRIDRTHVRLGDLYAAGRLPMRRAVFDASLIHKPRQREFVASLKRDGVEIVLDTQVAELAAKAKFQTYVKSAPWASLTDGELLDPSYFDQTSQTNIIAWIARFAVEQGVNTVLAPTHFLGDKDFSDWLTIDLQSCESLRRELNREGGQHISIDYPIIHNHTALNLESFRNQIVERIVDLPIDSVWIRASGLGNQPKPQAVKQFLKTLYDFQRCGKPMIMDHVDGLMAQALVAFGGASGTAVGVGERDQLNTNNWHKLPKERSDDDDFRRATYIPISGLGRRLSKKELEFLSSAKGGRKYLGCQDPCCAHGVKDMLSDPRQHAAYQATAPIRALSEVPDLQRERHFIDKPLLDAERLARNIKDLNPSTVEAERLNIDVDRLKNRLGDHHRKIGKFSDALNTLHDERDGGAPRAAVCPVRVTRNTNKSRNQGQ